MTSAKYGDIEFERRVFPRFVIHLPFHYELDSRQGEGMTNNASLGGLQVYLADPLTVGDQLKINLTLPEGHTIQKIKAIVRVIWMQKSMLPPPKNFKAGLEFIEISDQALEFLQWFERLWLNQGS